MGTTTYKALSTSDVDAELELALEALGMSIEVAEQFAEVGALNAEQYLALRRIRDLQWLQGE